jgi:hypothetical protein
MYCSLLSDHGPQSYLALIIDRRCAPTPGLRRRPGLRVPSTMSVNTEWPHGEYRQHRLDVQHPDRHHLISHICPSSLELIGFT